MKIFLSILAVWFLVLAYYFWYDNYQMAESEKSSLERDITTYKRLLEGDGCYPPLSQITDTMMDDQLRPWQELRKALEKMLPDEQSSDKLKEQMLTQANGYTTKLHNLNVGHVKKLDFYTETPFYFQIDMDSANSSAYLESFSKEGQLVDYELQKVSGQSMSVIEGKAFAFLPSSQGFIEKEYCVPRPTRVWLPPYTYLVEEKLKEHQQLCHATLKHKPILVKKDRLGWLQQDVLARAEIARVLKKSIRPATDKNFKLELPVPCLIRK